MRRLFFTLAVACATLLAPASARASTVWTFHGQDSFGSFFGGGMMEGTIYADDNGVITSAHVFNWGTGNVYNNGNGEYEGSLEYTYVGSPDTTDGFFAMGSQFTYPTYYSHFPEDFPPLSPPPFAHHNDVLGQVAWNADNLEFNIDAPLDGSVSLVNVLSSSTRFDEYGDRIGFSGTLTLVPEPTSLALLGVGGLAAAARRRRRVQA